MPSPGYYATYCRFTAHGKDEFAALLGADSIVGDQLQIVLEPAGQQSQAVLVNRFGARIGTINPDMTEQIQLAQARGWHTGALLASVYLSDTDDGASYWGEVVVLCHADDPAFSTFATTLSGALAQGIRPNVELGESGVDQVIQSGGAWLPTGRTPLPDTQKGTALVKDRMSPNEHVVELARKRNPGCMAAGVAFILALVAGAVWLVLKLLGG